MTHDDLERLRARFAARATTPPSDMEKVEDDALGPDDVLYRHPDVSMAADWPAWVALAEAILGVTREEVAALLAPPPEPVWWPTSPGSSPWATSTPTCTTRPSPPRSGRTPRP